MKTVTKVCEMCGQTFEAKSRLKRFCDRDHYATCCICGKQFLIPKNNVGYYFDRLDRVTCSSECKAKLSVSQHTSEERAAAIRNGMIKKYGVVNAGQLKSVIEKREQTNIERYGNKAPTATAKVQAKTRKTNLERYGTEYVTQTESFKQKAKETNLAKYGVESYAQTAEFQQKSAQTMKERYGVKHALQSPEIVAQMKARNLEKYGVDHPMKLPEVQAKNRAAKLEHFGDENYQNEPKKIQTNLERYGKEYYTQTAEYRQRVEATNLRKYGVKHHLQSPEVIAKRKLTCNNKYGATNVLTSEYGKSKSQATLKKKYGVVNYAQTDEYLKAVISNPDRLEYWKSYRSEPAQFIASHFDHKPSLLELADFVGVEYTTAMAVAKRFGCYDMITHVTSYMEQDIIDFLKRRVPNIIIERHNRKIIAPYELDIYLPEYHLAIECNPTYTHNSSFASFDKLAGPTPAKYHQMKTDMCEKQNVFLFHIFGYDWAYKRKIIESMLQNLLGCNRHKIYARDTVLKVVSFSHAAKFLDENHRQGKTVAPIRLGLFTKDTNELVSLMTFGRMRPGIGTGREDLSDCYELVRFCNKLNTSVIGGASKLFKYFVTNYSPVRVRSFSDRAHTRGGLYQTLGFQEIRRSNAGYVWVDAKTDIAYHRLNAQKQNICKFLKDDSLDVDNKTEKELMESHGYVAVYDSGTITWEWNR